MNVPESKVETSVVDEEDDNVEDEEPPKTKADALKQRLRKLKLKMNQARQLNKQEVLREGERLGSMEGAAKARKRQMTQDKKLKEAEWKARNAKALEIAKAHGVDGKHLVEQADTSLVRCVVETGDLLNPCSVLTCSHRSCSSTTPSTDLYRKKPTERKKRPRPTFSKLMITTIPKANTAITNGI